MKSVPFDEAAYLAVNPDVAAAVKAKAIPSGKVHFAEHGHAERRSLAKRQRSAPLPLPFAEGIEPNRRDRILGGLDVGELKGLEIGALASPMVWPDEGNIFFVDHVDTHSLRKKYESDPSVNINDLVNVNAVWGKQTLEECVGSNNKFDYVVASHVIEHVPDLISWLSEIRNILCPSGTLRLAIPDRRYTFDYLRNESQIHDVLDAFIRRARAPLPRMIIDHFSSIRVVDCQKAWNGTLDVANLKPYSSTLDAFKFAMDAFNNGTYHDTHCWVFTPLSFADICIKIAELGLLEFKCGYYFSTEVNQLEFVVHLNACIDKAEIVESWKSMKFEILNS